MSKTKMPNTSYVCTTTRYICTVLDEMRECHKSHNYSYFHTLIEEAQMLSNRMEAKLEYYKNIGTLEEDISKLKAAREAIKIEVQELIDIRDSVET